MLSQHVGRAIWIHHHDCGFDWPLIDKYRPDEVWWAPTERFLLSRYRRGSNPGFDAEAKMSARASWRREAAT